MGPWMHGSGWDGWGWMVLWNVVWVALIVAAVVAVVVLVRRETTRTREPDPLRILAERLARGEIDVEEYERRKQALR